MSICVVGGHAGLAGGLPFDVGMHFLLLVLLLLVLLVLLLVVQLIPRVCCTMGRPKLLLLRMMWINLVAA